MTGRNGDGNGCDGGSPQDFSYNGIGAGIEEPLGGIFTMTGNVNNNQAWTDDLLNVISAAVIPTVQCSTESAQHCILKKRETPAIARDCGDMDLNQCTMANFVQATMLIIATCSLFCLTRSLLTLSTLGTMINPT